MTAGEKASDVAGSDTSGDFTVTGNLFVKGQTYAQGGVQNSGMPFHCISEAGFDAKVHLRAETHLTVGKFIVGQDSGNAVIISAETPSTDTVYSTGSDLKLVADRDLFLDPTGHTGGDRAVHIKGANLYIESKTIRTTGDTVFRNFRCESELDEAGIKAKLQDGGGGDMMMGRPFHRDNQQYFPIYWSEGGEFFKGEILGKKL